MNISSINNNVNDKLSNQAKQFSEVFVSYMMNAMFKDVNLSGLENSAANDYYKSLFVNECSKSLVEKGVMNSVTDSVLSTLIRMQEI